MRKIFYDPDRDNKIVGMTDGEDSFEFPYVETDTDYHATANLRVVDKEDPKLVVEKGTWEPGESPHLQNQDKRKVDKLMLKVDLLLAEIKTLKSNSNKDG